MKRVTTSYVALDTQVEITDTYNGMKMDANDSFQSVVEFANGATGAIHATRWACGHSNISLLLRVWGTRGALVVDLEKSMDEYRICVGEKALENNAWETIEASATPNVIQRFVDSIKTDRNGLPDFATAARVQGIP